MITVQVPCWWCQKNITVDVNDLGIFYADCYNHSINNSIININYRANLTVSNLNRFKFDELIVDVHYICIDFYPIKIKYDLRKNNIDMCNMKNSTFPYNWEKSIDRDTFFSQPIEKMIDKILKLKAFL